MNQIYDGRVKSIMDYGAFIELLGVYPPREGLCHISNIAPQRIHYKGSRGFELATSGNKVLIVPEKAKHVCKGTCPNCRCKDKKARAKARNTARAAVASGGAAVA